MIPGSEAALAQVMWTRSSRTFEGDDYSPGHECPAGYSAAQFAISSTLNPARTFEYNTATEFLEEKRYSGGAHRPGSVVFWRVEPGGSTACKVASDTFRGIEDSIGRCFHL
jgi:hypothetical protein